MSDTPLSRTLVILTAFALTAACSDPSGPRLLVDDGGEPESEALSVTPRTATIQAGGAVMLHANLVNESGKRIPAAVQWTSSRNAVATVSAGGEVKGHSAGRAIITARVAGMRQTAIIQVMGARPEKNLPGPHALRLR